MHSITVIQAVKSPIFGRFNKKTKLACRYVLMIFLPKKKFF